MLVTPTSNPITKKPIDPHRVLNLISESFPIDNLEVDPLNKEVFSCVLLVCKSYL